MRDCPNGNGLIHSCNKSAAEQNQALLYEWMAACEMETTEPNLHFPQDRLELAAQRSIRKRLK